MKYIAGLIILPLHSAATRPKKPITTRKKLFGKTTRCPITEDDLTNLHIAHLCKEVSTIVGMSPHNESVIFVGGHDQSLQFFSDAGGVSSRQ